MNERIFILLRKLIDGQFLDEKEKQELDNWTLQSPHNLSLYKYVNNSEALLAEIKELLREDSRASRDHLARIGISCLPTRIS